MIKLFLIVLFALFQTLLPQDIKVNNLGKIVKLELMNSPFPHKLRAKGHNYKDKFYSANTHYQDSTVLVFIPNYLIINDSLDFVFYFHGWYNNIDSSLSQFNLIEQFYNSHKNAIFVFPEGPKNAPDSFGGKLEEKDKFKYLLQELKQYLIKLFSKEIKIGTITLMGHSGAYRVISYILLHGGITDKIRNVFLFDGLYSDIEKFTFWIDNYNGKFINIYTPNGGTKLESENLMMCLSGWGISYNLIDKDDFSFDELEDRIIFIKSAFSHNEVISKKNQFQKFLESSL